MLRYCKNSADFKFVRFSTLTLTFNFKNSKIFKLPYLCNVGSYWHMDVQTSIEKLGNKICPVLMDLFGLLIKKSIS